MNIISKLEGVMIDSLTNSDHPYDLTYTVFRSTLCFWHVRRKST